jgi:hypothetical protein
LSPNLPRVSVVLPVWNGELFVARAVESILAQTFRSFELIVVDDGSTDRTASILEEFARRDRRVVLIRSAHGGLSHALNAGIDVARGLCIARMDADDVSLPKRLEKQMAYLDANPDCVVIGSGVEVIDDAGAVVGETTFAETHEAITAALIGGRSPIAHPTVVVRRDALVAAGGYDGSRYPSEDFDLWLKLSRVGRLANMSESLLQYRRHQGAVSVRDRAQQLAMTTSIVNEARRHLGMSPIRKRLLEGGRSHKARYHFDCARFALVGGRRVAAARHARISIANDPLCVEAYAALLACLLPRRTLRYMVELRARLRAA